MPTFSGAVSARAPAGSATGEPRREQRGRRQAGRQDEPCEADGARAGGKNGMRHGNHSPVQVRYRRMRDAAANARAFSGQSSHRKRISR